jgi:hypothetical protein
MREAERDISGKVVQKKTKTSALEDQKRQISLSSQYENSAKIPAKQKHEGGDTPKMDGKTQ